MNGNVLKLSVLLKRNKNSDIMLSSRYLYWQMSTRKISLPSCYTLHHLITHCINLHDYKQQMNNFISVHEIFILLLYVINCIHNQYLMLLFIQCSKNSTLPCHCRNYLYFSRGLIILRRWFITTFPEIWDMCGNSLQLKYHKRPLRS